MKQRTWLEYKDMWVTIFGDLDKGLSIFVNDKGMSEVINYESNFFSVEDCIVAYDKLLTDSLSYHGEIRDIDMKDYKKALKKYVRHIIKAMGGDVLDYDYLEYMGVKL